MRKQVKGLLAMLLALLMLITVFPVAAFAEQAEQTAQAEQTEETERPLGRIYVERPRTTGLSDAAAARRADNTQKSALPSSYNSATLGYVTDVRSQDYGDCWAHGAVASVESYMIKNGITDASTGAAATRSINLSEYQLAWYNYTYAYDKLGMLNGDRSIPYSNYLELGGFGEMATYTFMRWEGPASETTPALAYKNASLSGLGGSYAYQANIAHVQGVDWIPTKNMDAVKQAIMTYGAGTFGYYHDDTYENASNGAYCFKQSASYDSDNFYYSNHDVTVVGWDDNYSRNNFNSVSRPSKNGAWIIKNSWGTGAGDKGYHYISYEDSASLNDYCYFYQVEPLDNYDNIYQYDGTNNFSNGFQLSNGSSIASVFQANGSETLKAASICTWDEGTNYTLRVYRGVSADNPSSGTLVATQSGSIPFTGYHTIKLNQPVELSAGERYAVVFQLSTAYADQITVPVDVTGSSSGYVSWVHTAHSGTSFAKDTGDAGWSETTSNGNYYNVRIKAYTTDSEPPIPNETPFVDVDPRAYYYDAVVWALEQSVTAGIDATHFKPNDPCTRAQVVTFLWRVKGSPEPTTSVNPFFDVQDGKFYSKAVLWAVEHGITTGADPTHFKPDAPCTRGQVVTFLWRTAGSPAPSSNTNPFTDVQSTAYYFKAILWAVEKKITNGMSATSFAPNNTCTRGQIVTFLYRAKDSMSGSLGTVTIVDKRALFNAIATAQSKNQNDYTAESWAKLASALSAAQTVYANNAATQAQVDSATNALISAINALEVKPTSPDTVIVGYWYSFGIYNTETEEIAALESSDSTLTIYANHTGMLTLGENSYNFTWSYQKTDSDGDYFYVLSASGENYGFYHINSDGQIWLFVGDYMFMYKK